MAPLPQLDLDERGNAHLQSLVQKLHPRDASIFVKGLTKQPLRERFHLYRELLLGAQIRQGGADFRYEQKIDRKTPDWSLMENGRLVELIDVITLHQRKEMEIEITTSIRASNRWTGWSTIPPDHIYRKLTEKAEKYSELVCKRQAPFVLAVFGDFLAAIEPEEVEYVLNTQHGGWFSTAPDVSGIIYFHEKNFRFEFTYFPNASAKQPAIWSNRIHRWNES
jgi:hypothetical protein